MMQIYIIFVYAVEVMLSKHEYIVFQQYTVVYSIHENIKIINIAVSGEQPEHICALKTTKNMPHNQIYR